MRASIILPAYNEEKNIPSVLKKIPSKYEIIVVDDGSMDRTLEAAKKYGCVCIRLNKNFGKGFACVTGAKLASYENIVFMDSDGQLDAGDIPKMLSALHKSDLVVGTRDMESVPPHRKMSNDIARIIVSKAAGRKLGDVLCGFRAVRKMDFLKMNLVKRRYEIEAEMIIKAVKKNMKIKEVPVSVKYGIGSSMPIKESLRVTSYIVKEAAKKSLF